MAGKVVAMMNVFDFAIDMEKQIYGHYEQLAAHAGSGESRRIFTLLAEAEREHVEHLSHLKEHNDPVLATSMVLETLKPRLEKLVRVLTHHDMQESDLDGYRQAIKTEEVSIRLYEKLAERETDPSVSGLLMLLANEEKCHLEEVENIYDFVESPRTYLASGEFSNLSHY